MPCSLFPCLTDCGSYVFLTVLLQKREPWEVRISEVQLECYMYLW